MRQNFRRLALGLVLVLSASALVLAFSKEGRNRSPERPLHIAILQHASNPVLDEGVAGVVEGLAANGFRDGEGVIIQKYNPEGDVGLANNIAQNITSGEFDLVVTISTPSLQAVANANRTGRTKHVFGLVAVPSGAGVGIDPDDPLRHPPWMVGLGAFLPVAEGFRMARQMYPRLKQVGVVWNPAEPNSVAFTRAARQACQELGIELLEATVAASSEVREAFGSLLARGIQALWVGGDVMVGVALEPILADAKRTGIPVFTITPAKPDRGTLFDLGISFQQAGRLTGDLAAEVLRGGDLARMPVRDVMDRVPRLLIVNKLALRGLKDPWQIPDAILRDADVVVDEQGIHRKASGANPP